MVYHHPITHKIIHGTGILTYIWVDSYGFYVGKYTIHTWILWVSNHVSWFYRQNWCCIYFILTGWWCQAMSLLNISFKNTLPQTNIFGTLKIGRLTPRKEAGSSEPTFHLQVRTVSLIRLMVQKSGVHQLIWYISHNLRGLYIQKVVVWDFWTINSMIYLDFVAAKLLKTSQMFIFLDPRLTAGALELWGWQFVHHGRVRTLTLQRLQEFLCLWKKFQVTFYMIS